MYLNKMKSRIRFFTSVIIISFSFVSLYGQNDILNYNRTEYKAYYTALLIEKFRPDTVWHDGISCSMPEDLDELASREIDSLVNVSIENLWSQSDERSDFKGDRETWVLDPLCVALELLAVLNSNDLDVLARAYAERETNEQIKGKE